MFATRFKMAVMAAAVSAALLAAPAWAQPYSSEPYGTQGTPTVDDLGGTVSGIIGQDPAVTKSPTEPDTVPLSLPPAFDMVEPPVTTPAAAPAAPAQAVPQFKDACASYTNGDAYNMCQDRIKKIERMRDAKNRRMGIESTPVIMPTETTVKTEAETDQKAKAAIDKVEELEKKLKEKEAAEAAKKAAPTTKKGIGDFDRNPAKGSELFK